MIKGLNAHPFSGASRWRPGALPSTAPNSVSFCANVHYIYRYATGRWALRTIFAVYILRAVPSAREWGGCYGEHRTKTTPANAYVYEEVYENKVL
jgi:hypothetical protein